MGILALFFFVVLTAAYIVCGDAVVRVPLHIEMKRALVAEENDAEALKRLVGVSRSRFFAENRALRHVAPLTTHDRAQLLAQQRGREPLSDRGDSDARRLEMGHRGHPAPDHRRELYVFHF